MSQIPGPQPVSIKYPFLFNGQSDQPAHVRFQTQVEEALNVSFSVADGMSKRPGSRNVTYTAYSPYHEGLAKHRGGSDYRLATIDRDANEKYLILYGSSIFRIFELYKPGTADESLVEAGITFNGSTFEYLTRKGASSTGITVADGTWASKADTEGTITKAGAFSSYTFEPGDQIFWHGDDAGGAGTNYYYHSHVISKDSDDQITIGVTIEKGTNADFTAGSSILDPSGSGLSDDDIDITDIVRAVDSDAVRFTTVNDFTFAVNTNVATSGDNEAGTIDATTMPVKIVRTAYTGDGSTPATFEVSEIDWKPRQKTITPNVTTGLNWNESDDRVGTTNAFSNYTDHYSGDTLDVLSGTDVIPGTYRISSIVNTNTVELASDITSSASDQSDITVGDIVTRDTERFRANPLPSIIKDGKKISDITSHRNRLVLAGDENVVMSQTGDFFNLWIDDPDNLVDTDRIDVSLSSNRVTLIDYIVTFRQTLILFTKAGQQFELNAPETLSPDTIAITPSTRYDSTPGVRPITLASLIYFTSPYGSSTRLYEYFYDDARITNFANDVTSHVRTLLPDSIHSLSGSPNDETIIVSPNGSGERFVYRSFHSARQKEQSAWSKWTYGGRDLLDTAIIDNTAYSVSTDGDKSAFIFDATLLSDTEFDDESVPWYFKYKLDRLTDTSKYLRSYDSGTNTTTFTLLSAYADDTIDTIVLGPSFGSREGEMLDVSSATTSENATYDGLVPDTTTVTYVGEDLSSGDVALGRSYTAEAKLTRPFVRDQQGNADTDARLFLQRIVARYHDTGALTLRMTYPGISGLTANYDESFAPGEVKERGDITAWYGGPVEDMSFVIRSESHLPFTVTSVEFVGEYSSGITE